MEDPNKIHPDDKGLGDKPPDKGLGDVPPVDKAGLGEDWEKRFKDTQQALTRKSEILSRLKDEAKLYGDAYIDSATGEVTDELLEQFHRDKGYTLTELQKKMKEFENPDEIPDDKPKVDPNILNLAKKTLQISKKTEYLEFKEMGETLDPEIRKEVEREIDNLLETNPRFLNAGNWYKQALKSKMMTAPDFLTKIEQEGVRKEKERESKLGSLGGGLGEGAKAGGESKTLEKELKERLG